MDVDSELKEPLQNRGASAVLADIDRKVQAALRQHALQHTPADAISKTASQPSNSNGKFHEIHRKSSMQQSATSPSPSVTAQPNSGQATPHPGQYYAVPQLATQAAHNFLPLMEPTPQEGQRGVAVSSPNAVPANPAMTARPHNMPPPHKEAPYQANGYVQYYHQQPANQQYTCPPTSYDMYPANHVPPHQAPYYPPQHWPLSGYGNPYGAQYMPPRPATHPNNTPQHTTQSQRHDYDPANQNVNQYGYALGGYAPNTYPAIQQPPHLGHQVQQTMTPNAQLGQARAPRNGNYVPQASGNAQQVLGHNPGLYNQSTEASALPNQRLFPTFTLEPNCNAFAASRNAFREDINGSVPAPHMAPPKEIPPTPTQQFNNTARPTAIQQGVTPLPPTLGSGTPAPDPPVRKTKPRQIRHTSIKNPELFPTNQLQGLKRFKLDNMWITIIKNEIVDLWADIVPIKTDDDTPMPDKTTQVSHAASLTNMPQPAPETVRFASHLTNLLSGNGIGAHAHVSRAPKALNTNIAPRPFNRSKAPYARLIIQDPHLLAALHIKKHDRLLTTPIQRPGAPPPTNVILPSDTLTLHPFGDDKHYKSKTEGSTGIVGSARHTYMHWLDLRRQEGSAAGNGVSGGWIGEEVHPGAAPEIESEWQEAVHVAAELGRADVEGVLGEIVEFWRRQSGGG